MKLYSIIKMFLSLSFLLLPSGRVYAGDESGNGTIVLMQHDTGWMVTINSDGSGSVNFGSNLFDSASFPRGTVDFKLIARNLNETPAVSAAKSLSFRVMDSKSAYEKNKVGKTVGVEGIRSHIDKIIQKCEPRNRDRFERLLKLKPLLPPIK